MLSAEAIAQINANLSLCDTYTLTQHEIDVQNGLGADPSTICEYWTTTQDVVNIRAETDTTMNQVLENLVAFANVDGCVITLEPEVVPEVNIPYFGGGL